MQARLAFLVHLFSILLLSSSPAFSADGSTPSDQSVYRPGNINQADIALLADVARARYDVDGSGLKIGVISDSFNYLGGEAYDVDRGVLPYDVSIVHDDGNGEDEGRAMAQLVHAVAPGAKLYFSSSMPYGDPSKISLEETLAIQETFAERIRELVELGCDIIVDDIYIPAEPWFQDGPISLAVDTAVESGVAYFSAAGNHSNVSYQSNVSLTEAPSSLIDYWNDPSSGTSPELAEALSNPDLSFHNFAQGDETIVLQRVQIPNFGVTSSFWIQWDQPWGANDSAVDVWFFDENKRPIGKAGGFQAYPAAFTSFFGLPAQPGFPALPALGSSFFVAFTHNADGFDGVDGKKAPGFFKWIAVLNGQGTIRENPQNVIVDPPSGFQGASTTWGHNNSRLGAAVAAAAYWNTPAYNRQDPRLTTFSSWGGTPIFFDAAGNRLPEPELRHQPRFTAPQEGNTSFFANLDPEIDLLKNFQGTSAAAPNSAAVAALMLELDPTLDPSEIYQILAETAVKVPAPQYDPPYSLNDQLNYATGAGLIRADHALAHVAGLSIQGIVFRDSAQNRFQSHGDRPLPGYGVFLDSNRNGRRDVAPPAGSGAELISFQASGPIEVDTGEVVTNPNVWPADSPQNAGEYFGDPALAWPQKALSPIQVSEMPGTITNLELTYEIRANSNSGSGIPFFLTLVSPLGIRVPVVGTVLSGGSFEDPETIFDSSGNSLPDTQTYTRTVSMGATTDENKALGNLNAFKGLPANGSWQLEFMNPDPNRTYTLESWTLSLQTEERLVTTDHDGRYAFPASSLSFSSVVGPYTPTIELPTDQFITTHNTVFIGRRNPNPIVDIGVSSPQPDPKVIKTGRVNWRGKVKIKGRVRYGQRVATQTEGVYCRTFRYGRFVCRGRNLQPGLQVEIILAQPQSVRNSESPEAGPSEWRRAPWSRFGGKDGWRSVRSGP